MQLNLSVLKPYKTLFTDDKRYVLMYGGRAGGRSYSASQKVLLDTVANEYSRSATMRYVLGDVRSSVWQETKDRIEEHELPEVTSDQAMHYEYRGNTIDGKGFKKSSSQNIAKLKSLAGYNLIWIEEADEITEEDFDNLDSSIRTQKANNTIILTFNMPNKEHWIIKRWFNLVESEYKGYYKAVPKTERNSDTTFIFSTYKDNEANLTESVVNTFELFRTTNPEYYYTMIQGLVSEGKRGRVFPNWKPMSEKEYEELPYEEYYGLDFGFTNDPSALVGLKHHNNNVYCRELMYERGLTNPDISKKLNDLNVKGLIIADSAEPKSIEELKRLGHKIQGSVKGPDSIRAGISLINSYNVSYTEGSINLATELQNYIYSLDRDKNPTNKPSENGYDHLLDAFRYCAQYKLTKNTEVNLTWI